MSLVSVKGDKGQEVIVNFPVVKDFHLSSIIEFPIHTSAKAIFISAGISLFALMLLTPSGRHAAINCFKKLKPIPAILRSMGAFLFTLKPTRNGMPMILLKKSERRTVIGFAPKEAGDPA